MENTDKKQRTPQIGAYLIERLRTARSDVDRALCAQDALRQKGTDAPLGDILAAFPGIEQTILEECLRTQRVDILGRVELFSPLPVESLQELAARLSTQIVPAGTMIFRQGDHPESYYVIVSGAVRILRRDAEGVGIVLDRRGPGEGFGEIAILTEESHSSSAETTERTSFLAIPRETFLTTVFSLHASALTIAKILAARLSRGYGKIMEAAESEQSFRRFLTDQLRRDEPMLIGNSPVIMKLIGEIETLAAGKIPVLVRGEPGTEKKDAAALIHDMGRDDAGLLLFLDANLGDGTVGDALRLELNQTATLFGRGQNAVPFAPDRKPGQLAMAADGTVVIENVEHLAPRVQERLRRYLESGVFAPLGETEEIRSNARIIATTSADLQALAVQDRFDPRLARLLSSRILKLPPLRRRKQDLAITVEELIRRTNRALGKNTEGIDEDAAHALVNYDWPGNTEELRVVIRRAVSISRGGRLSSEDIFIGPPPVTGRYTVNLLAFEPVRRLLASKFYPAAAHFVTIPFIVVIVGLGLFGPQLPDRNLALILTWGLWEPTLVLSALFFGRAWCSVCPIGAISTLVRRFAGRNRKVPLWIKNRGFYFTAAGIALIFWLETAVAMPLSPVATAMLVAPLVLLAGLAGFLFQRRTWCRYLCPLGGMMGIFATTSVVEMRSNYGICNSTCLKHECYAGSEDREGCPMFEGPFALSSNRTCVLCANCVKVCPNHSPVLNLRVPGYDLWTQHAPDRAFAVLTITLLGTQLFRGAEMLGALQPFRAGPFSWFGGTFLLLLGFVLFAWFFALIAGRTAFGNRAGGQETWRIAYALLPQIFAFEAGFHLERFLVLTGQFLTVLGHQLELSRELPGWSAPLPMIRLLQTFLVLAGTAGSAVVLAKLPVQEGESIRFSKRSWPLLILAALYLVIFLDV